MFPLLKKIHTIINNSFNASLKILRSAIDSDREEIRKSFQGIKDINDKFIRKFFILDQLTILKNLEHKLDQIQDNIVSAKNNIVHPNILTSQEIEDFGIDFYKLKMLKVGIMTVDSDSLVIALQIPDSFIKTDLRLIIPIPNANNLEIYSEEEYIININGKFFKYQDNVPRKNLRKSKHCIFYNNCKFNFNNNTEIISIGEEIIIVKNAYSENLEQNCDDREFKLNGNYFIVFNNCDLTVRNEEFSNRKIVFRDRYFYPSTKIMNNSNVNANFQNIKIDFVENIKEIKELQFHKNISYGINITLGIIIVVSCFILYFLMKKNNVNINIKNQRVEENCQIDNKGQTSTPQISISEITQKYIK